MGILDAIRGNSQPGISAHTGLSLTEDGKRACDQMLIRGKTAEAIMNSLDEHSPQSLSSIVKEANLSFHDAQKKAIQLAQQGLIKPIDTGMVH